MMAAVERKQERFTNHNRIPTCSLQILHIRTMKGPFKSWLSWEKPLIPKTEVVTKYLARRGYEGWSFLLPVVTSWSALWQPSKQPGLRRLLGLHIPNPEDPHYYSEERKICYMIHFKHATSEGIRNKGQLGWLNSLCMLPMHRRQKG